MNDMYNYNNVNNNGNQTLPKKNNTGRLGVAFFFVIAVAVVLVATVFGDLQQVFENKRQTEELNSKYIELFRFYFTEKIEEYPST